MVSLGDIARTFGLVGLTSWGGPAIVAQIRDAVVTRRHWLTDEEFNESVALCQIVPGPMAPLTSTHVGWRLRGAVGGMVALIAYIAPSVLLMLLLSVAYARFGGLPSVERILAGMRAAAVGILMSSVWMMGPTALRDSRGLLCAALAFPAFLLGLDPLVVLPLTAALGTILARPIRVRRPVALPPSADRQWRSDLFVVGVVTLALGMAVFLASLFRPILRDILGVMTHANLLAFGGGYTAVAVMHDSVVNERAWLEPQKFVDALTLAQLTPGPVTCLGTFVGYVHAGVPGALVATAGAFLPSALVLVGAAPVLVRLEQNTYVQGALRGLLGAFIAMLLAMMAMMARTALTGPLAMGIAAVSCVILLFRVSPVWVIIGTGILAAFVRL